MTATSTTLQLGVLRRWTPRRRDRGSEARSRAGSGRARTPSIRSRPHTSGPASTRTSRSMAACLLSTRSSVSPSSTSGKPPCRDGPIQRGAGRLPTLRKRRPSTGNVRGPSTVRSGSIFEGTSEGGRGFASASGGGGVGRGRQLAVERGDKGLDARLDAAARPSRYTGRGQRPPLRALLGTRGPAEPSRRPDRGGARFPEAGARSATTSLGHRNVGGGPRRRVPGNSAGWMTPRRSTHSA